MYAVSTSFGSSSLALFKVEEVLTIILHNSLEVKKMPLSASINYKVLTICSKKP